MTHEVCIFLVLDTDSTVLGSSLDSAEVASQQAQALLTQIAEDGPSSEDDPDPWDPAAWAESSLAQAKIVQVLVRGVDVDAVARGVHSILHAEGRDRVEELAQDLVKRGLVQPAGIRS